MRLGRQVAVMLGLLSTLGALPTFAGPDGGVGRAAQVVFGGRRPVTLSVPTAYDAKVPAPLVLVLHGYGSSGKQHEDYFGLTSLVEEQGVLLAAPDGTEDAKGNRFWDARSTACCNFGGPAVDDLKYLRTLLKEIRGVYNVDPRRIYVVGHSNGGFMAHRLGCELSKDIAAVVSLAGTASLRGTECRARRPVSVLQIHGDQDQGVRYEGGTNLMGKGGGAYVGAGEMTARWARVDGCKGPRSAGEPLDLDSVLAGEETTASSFTGCPAGTDVTLWTIGGGSHVPALAVHFPGLVWAWLEAHPRH